REYSRQELRRKLIAQLARAAWRRRLLSAHQSPSEALAGNDDVESGDVQTQAEPLRELHECVDQALDQLEAQGMLSDARFVKSRVRVRAPRYGALRIEHELKHHGLSPELMREAKHALEATEYERALAVWARKFGQVAVQAQERAKQARFLSARGFSAEVIGKVLRQDASAE
ncbi:MAG TPA: RecX family transcriptional regulator, partial [Burkholderiaceae bacterium]|nr:RecX family transcriptional regulator [Burkholderiaceae bacterium]